MSETEDYVAAVFGPRGYLAQHLPTYEARVGQLELAYHVHNCFEAEAHALAEAPTGTGKTMAYSVPAVWHAAKHGRRTVIVTANIALQEQLMRKDLPLLEKVLPWKFTFALAKGIGNYLCLEQFDDTVDGSLMGFEWDTVEESRQWQQVAEWTEHTKTGDITELPFETLPTVRSKFTTTSDDCLGGACPRKGECSALRARENYREADIVVTNYHLFFADLAIRGIDPEKGVLPRYQRLVFDEGHKAPDIAREFFGFRVTPYAVRWAGRLLVPAANKRKKRHLPVVSKELKDRLQHASDSFFGRLRMVYHGDAYEARLRKAGQVGGESLVQVLKEVELAYTAASESEMLNAPARQELRNCAARAGTIAVAIEAADELREAKDCVYFLEENGDRVYLSMKPIGVAESLRRVLFTGENRVPTAVVSATLTTGGKSGFTHVRGELGIDEAAELITESPFDHQTNAVLVIPRGMPEPNDKPFAAAVARTAVQVARLSEGRMLGLFTSFRVMREVRDAMVDLPWLVLTQGDAPRTQLIERFKQDEHSILLGCESFWQGVDVPGSALSVVLIDRLPFATPEDPVLDAVSAADARWFHTYCMPRAIIAVRQGAGRLIRSRTDRGVIVLCDKRIETKPYGQRFIRALPKMRLHRDVKVVRTFLEQVDGGTG